MHHSIPVSRARPTGSAFLAHGFLTDADVIAGVVEILLGALVTGWLLNFAVVLFGFFSSFAVLLLSFCVELRCF